MKDVSGNTKRKINKMVNKSVKADTIKIAILCIPILYVIVMQIIKGEFSLMGMLDSDILISFVVVFICETIAQLIINEVGKKTEEAVKLTDDYDGLVKKYSSNKSKMASIGEGDNKQIFPEIVLCQRRIDGKPFKFEIKPRLTEDGAVVRYQLPSLASSHSETLMGAHNHSKVYNNLNVRLNGLICDEGNNIKLDYQYTTYFDSLITNRAMDYEFMGSTTMREVYEPGPRVTELQYSKLSNHLGFNGFVELSDGKLIFINRSTDVSIGKGVWSQSIGASLKTMYCLDDDGFMTAEKLSDAIRGEIYDELKIKIDTDEDMCDSIFAFYRDLLEGGKPQFLFYYKTNKYTEKTFLDNFKTTVAKEKEERAKKEGKASPADEMKIDGDKFAFYTIDQLKACEYKSNMMVYKAGKDEKVLRMLPSSLGSIALLLQNI